MPGGARGLPAWVGWLQEKRDSVPGATGDRFPVPISGGCWHTQSSYTPSPAPAPTSAPTPAALGRTVRLVRWAPQGEDQCPASCPDLTSSCDLKDTHLWAEMPRYCLVLGPGTGRLVSVYSFVWFYLLPREEGKQWECAFNLIFKIKG